MSLRAACLPLLLAFLTPAGALAAEQALPAAGAGVSDAELARFVDEVMRDPAAMARNHAVMERLSAPQMTQAIESSGNTHFSWLYPMVLRAADYPALAGTPIAQMSVMAVRGDKLVPIPFQVDEFDKKGLIYIPGVPTPSPLNPGLFTREREPNGTAGAYDRNDELVFMFRDGGLRRATTDELAKVGGTALAAIELRYQNLPVRYAYIMVNNPQRSSADYVHVNVDKGLAQTTVADIAWNPKSMAMLKRIAPRVGPSSGRNIIDGVYGEVSTGVMQKNLRVSLNTSDNIRIQPVAVHDGAVRAVMLVKLRVFYMGIPIFHDWMNVALYEQGATLLTRLSLDSLDAAKYFVNLIKEPRITATIDFADINGAEVRWQALDDRPERAIVDGDMNAMENEMNGLRFPGDWLWMDSKVGWQFFLSNNFSLDAHGLIEAFLDPMKLEMVYEDDPSVRREGERLPGAGPTFGIMVDGLPTIATTLLTSMRPIDLSRLKGIEDLIDQMIRLDDKGELAALNRNITLVHQKLQRQGRASNMADIADLFEKDMRHLGIRANQREKLIRVMRRSLIEGGSFENHRVGAVLKAAKRIAKEEGLDWDDLQYALQDNSLWFPDSVGAGGPGAFDHEVRNPPVATLAPP